MSEESKVIPIKQPEPTAEEIAFRQKENTVRALVELHSLMGAGTYAGNLTGRLYQARMFLEQMHATALRDMENDPLFKKPEEKNGTTP